MNINFAARYLSVRSIARVGALFFGMMAAFCWAQQSEDSIAFGVRFVCAEAQLQQVEPAMQQLLQSLKIPSSMVQVSKDALRGSLTYSLKGVTPGVSTLYMAWRQELDIHDATLQIPTGRGKSRAIQTVSQKEILLALLHPGRLTEFRGTACNVEALRDNIGIRQNIVMWAEDLTWEWPDGTAAGWNPKFWNKGTPVRGIPLYDALNDLFFNQAKYSIGCYTATKIVFVQAVLDYYHRIKKDPVVTELITKRLLSDGEPLVRLEPARMWSFEDDFEPEDMFREGKLLRIIEPAAHDNFVPGDWSYFLNTDKRTYEKTGYEGSNALYLGRNRFDDYYNDNNHHYAYREKLAEVYQWRNDVFSRSHDWAKIQPISADLLEKLGHSPEQGGLLMAYRVVPYYFGFEPLP